MAFRDQRLRVAIRAAHQRGRGIYGPQKIQTELASQGIAVGIHCTHKKKLKVTTDSKHSLPMAPHLLDRPFAQNGISPVWATDITYIPTDKGWLYLAAVKDLYACEIVGWAMAPWVMEALRAAYRRRKPKPGLTHHSDRGSQYCSKAHRALQASHGTQTSMSRKGSCWDNARMESFLGALKTECLHHHRFATREQARQVAFEYIEVFYNCIRRHAKIGHQIPAEFAKKFVANPPWAASFDDLPIH